MYDSGKCENDEPWATYDIRDPFPQDPTQRMNVDAGFNLSFGTEIVPGIRARYSNSKDKIAGKLSCIFVTINTAIEKR